MFGSPRATAVIIGNDVHNGVFRFGPPMQSVVTEGGSAEFR